MSRAASRTAESASLKRYNEKRDFSRTREPPGKPAKSSKKLRFVIQQHDARRMHYDFRLELDGVLKSWAVPKGPSLDPKDKRLAVETEDHPITYRSFEGTIPEGEYGAGAVIVWDCGTWTPEGDPHFGLNKGHLTFHLTGEKTNGRFDLVRLGGARNTGPKTNWLLIKRTDEHVHADAKGQLAEHLPHSVVSGCTVADVAKGVSRGKAAPRPRATSKSVSAASGHATAKVTRRPARAQKSAKLPALSTFELQLATLADAAPPGQGYVFEIKLDGYRALAGVDQGTVTLRSRNDLDWSKTFPRIAVALSKIKATQAVLDGEICFVTPEGHTSFQDLQHVMPRGRPAVVEDRSLAYFIFDLLFLDGEDLRNKPLVERKELLKSVLGPNPKSPLRYSAHLEAEGRTALTQACTLGLEGLIAKRSDARYEGGRSRSWFKLKCGKRQEFIIVGMTRAEGADKGFKSLLLGLHEDGGIRYAGKVGTGFARETVSDIGVELWKRVMDKPSVTNPPRERNLVWVKPQLICEVSFTEMTRDGSLRHPAFLGLRIDKPARSVKRERAIKPPAVLKDRREGIDGNDEFAGVRITHPDRVMDQQSGTTKAQLAAYYEAAAPCLLPFAAGRPLALVRCPQGDAQQCFFQKHTMAGLGKSVKQSKAGGKSVLYIDDVKGLMELVQFNVVELHGWGSRLPKPTKPDWIVFDFDPDTALPFSTVVDAALEIRDALAAVKLVSYVKTTGGKGLHVVVPIRPDLGWDRVKAFSKRIADTMAAQRPDRYVANMAKIQRRGKIFVDYLRNGEGATAVLPYSVRARPGATVAVPVSWRELHKIDPREFSVSNATKWMKQRRTDPWQDLYDHAQELPDLAW